MRTIVCYILLLASLTTIISCQKDESESNQNNNPNSENPYDSPTAVVNMIPEKTPIELTDNQKLYIQSANDFTFNLFRKAMSVKESSILSPLSVLYVLGMLNEGADGETAKEIMQVLGFNGAEKTDVNKFCANLIKNAPKVDPNVKLNMTNALFVNKHISLLPDYVQDMMDYYHAAVKSLDFSDTSAVNMINEWCGNQTDGMIDHILEKTTPDAVAYLLNAVLFKAEWTDKFNPEHTKEGYFNKYDGTRQILPMMSRNANALYVRQDGFAALCLPYSSGAFNMYVLLPDDGVTVIDVLEKMSAGYWEQTKGKMSNLERHSESNGENKESYYVKRIVDIQIPRFASYFHTDLTQPLREIGLNRAFTDEAEFPLISSSKMKISHCLQDAKIEVDEQGTKTAAVTITETLDAAIPETIVQFHADRPFAYLIQETTSGAIFFVGTYMGD